MAASTYHLSPNGPRLCKAEKGLCPYGLAGGPHFESQADAQAAYEHRMGQAFGLFETKKSPVERVRQGYYQERDEVLRTVRDAREGVSARIRAVKASAPVQNTMKVLAQVRRYPASVEARIQKLEDRMAQRSLEARAARDRHAAYLTAKYNRAVTALTPHLVPLTPDANVDVPALRPASAKPVHPDGKQRVTTAFKLQKGDRLESGLYVVSVKDEGESVRVMLRNDKGHRAGSLAYKDTDRVMVRRQSKREARSGVERTRPLTKLRESAFFQRVKAATELQREVLRTLVQVDRSKADTPVMASPRVKTRGETLRRATASAGAAQQDVASSLAAVAASRKRSRKAPAAA